MTLNNSVVAFIASLAGMLAGLGISNLKKDDVLRGKRLEIVDDDGKAWVTATDSGIRVLGEENGDYSQIVAGQTPYIGFFQGGSQRTGVGVFLRGNMAGLSTFDEGVPRIQIGSNDKKSVITAYFGEPLAKDESLFDATLFAKSAARIAAYDDGTADLQVSGEKGSKKVANGGSIEP